MTIRLCGTDMNNKPILFSAPMVRAILEGRKTMTRRMKGLEEINSEPDFYDFSRVKEDGRFLFLHAVDGEPVSVKCPYGVPGDRLWVRETWCPRWSGALALCKVMRPFYRATEDTDIHTKPDEWKWRPSIHMPRWASRITLEVVAVRVERLHAITPDDCLKEGIYWATNPDDEGGFVNLWTAINGDESWNANPWVWVVEFRRVCHEPTPRTVPRTPKVARTSALNHNADSTKAR